jgi:hypothetical protein
MTMPRTATAVAEFGFARPAELSDDQLEALCSCLDEDLPGAMAFIDQAAARSQAAGGYAYLSQSPTDMASKEDWNTLVGYLARLFASPFRNIATELMQRRYGVAVAFVNCCIVAAWLGEVDEDELWCLQSRMQLTPDC